MVDKQLQQYKDCDKVHIIFIHKYIYNCDWMKASLIYNETVVSSAIKLVSLTTQLISINADLLVLLMIDHKHLTGQLL